MTIINKLKYLFNRKDYALSNPSWAIGTLGNLFGGDKGVSRPMAQNSVVYTCVNKIATNITQAKVKFYYGDDPIPDNDPINILFDRPYINLTRSGFIEKSSSYFAMYGECFWFLVESAGQVKGTQNLPSQIIPLQPSLMKEVVDYKKGILLGWKYNNSIPMSINEVIHIKNENMYNPFRGISPLESIKADVDADYLASKYQKQFFVNGASPQIVFTTPAEDSTTPEQSEEFIKKWNSKHQGASNSYKAALLSAGMDIKSVGLSQNEMNFVDCRRYSSIRIMMAFGVPPPIAGEMENANYSNMKSAKQSFWDETLQNYLNKFEDAINSYIVWPYNRSMTMKFDKSLVAELARNDKDVADLINIYASKGIPINVLNKVFNNPIPPVEYGDIGYRTISDIPVGADPYEANKTVNTPPEPEKSIEYVMVKQIEHDFIENKSEKVEKTVRSRYLSDQLTSEKLFKNELNKYWFNQRSKILRKLNSGKSGENPEAQVLINSINIWEQENVNLETRFIPVFQVVAEIASKSALENIGFDSVGFKVTEKLIKHRISVLKQINNSTSNSINLIVENGVEKGLPIEDIANLIKEYYGNISKNRATVIAKTETSSLMNAQQQETYKEKGVSKKKWIGGTRPSHAAMNGVIKKIDEPFNVNGHSLMYPGDMNAGPDETINCKCCLIPIIE